MKDSLADLYSRGRLVCGIEALISIRTRSLRASSLESPCVPAA